VVWLRPSDCWMGCRRFSCPEAAGSSSAQPPVNINGIVNSACDASARTPVRSGPSTGCAGPSYQFCANPLADNRRTTCRAQRSWPVCRSVDSGSAHSPGRIQRPIPPIDSGPTPQAGKLPSSRHSQPGMRQSRPGNCLSPQPPSTSEHWPTDAAVPRLSTPSTRTNPRIPTERPSNPKRPPSPSNTGRASSH